MNNEIFTYTIMKNYVTGNWELTFISLKAGFIINPKQKAVYVNVYFECAISVLLHVVGSEIRDQVRESRWILLVEFARIHEFSPYNLV